jgi:hypothetical protein
MAAAAAMRTNVTPCVFPFFDDGSDKSFSVDDFHSKCLIDNAYFF